MDVPQSLVQQMLITSKPAKTISSETIARLLEKNGWTRAIAGDVDFDKAVRGIKMAHDNCRGLLLIGVAGVGKTALLKTIHKVNGAELSQFVYCKDKNAIGWMKNSASFYMNRSVYVDDIGCEEIIKEYGNTSDVVGDLIQMYHDKGRGYFYGATNLVSKQLNEKYGSRVLDRLLVMCVVIKFEGKSKRKVMVV